MHEGTLFRECAGWASGLRVARFSARFSPDVVGLDGFSDSTRQLRVPDAGLKMSPSREAKGKSDDVAIQNSIAKITPKVDGRPGGCAIRCQYPGIDRAVLGPL